MSGCKKLEDKRVPPDTAEFHEHFQTAFRGLCVDFAFLEEFLSRENLLGVTDPSSAHQAANNVFLTYCDSLYLGVAKLADGSSDALSLQNFRVHYQKLPRWAEPDCESEYSLWGKAFDAWMESTAKATILIYRHENLGHSLPQGAARGRTRGAYKGFEGNSAGRYMSKKREVLESCREGIRLLRWLTKLCGIANGYSVDCFGFEGAAEKDLHKEIEKCRHFHAALLDLI
jgi:hypothetical protein